MSDNDLIAVLAYIALLPICLLIFLIWGGKQPWWPNDGGP